MLRSLIVLSSTLAAAAAHGHIWSVTTGDKTYPGYIPYSPNDAAPLIAWSTQNASNIGYLNASDYASSDIICHRNAKPGATHATVAAGDTLSIQWFMKWEYYEGPILSYLAKCPGDCKSVDKSTLRWFKTGEAGLVNATQRGTGVGENTGTFATDALLANNKTWPV